MTTCRIPEDPKFRRKAAIAYVDEVNSSDDTHYLVDLAHWTVRKERPNLPYEPYAELDELFDPHYDYHIEIDWVEELEMRLTPEELQFWCDEFMAPQNYSMLSGKDKAALADCIMNRHPEIWDAIKYEARKKAVSLAMKTILDEVEL
jgi:hypothetical protein